MLVVSPIGGNVERWQYGATDVFFPRGHAINAKGELRISGGMHQCLPNFGMLPEAVAEYGLPQHGPLRGTLCTGIVLHDIRENRQSHWSVSMEFRLPGSSSFPWSIYGAINVTALPNGFLYEVEGQCTGINGESTPMPMCFGLHPYFNMPQGGSVNLPDGERRVFQPMQPEFVRIGKTANIHLDAIGDVVMDMGGYSDVVIWSDSFHYGCVEPITGNSRLFGSPEGKHLSPGDFFRFHCRFEFKPEKE